MRRTCELRVPSHGRYHPRVMSENQHRSRGRPTKAESLKKKAKNIALTPEAIKILKCAAKRLGQSESALVEMCIRSHIKKMS